VEPNQIDSKKRSIVPVILAPLALVGEPFPYFAILYIPSYNRSGGSPRSVSLT
jgi:hypothetical protein